MFKFRKRYVVSVLYILLVLSNSRLCMADIGQFIESLERNNLIVQSVPITKLLFGLGEAGGLMLPAYPVSDFDSELHGEWGLFDASKQYIYRMEHGRFDVAEAKLLGAKNTSHLWSGRFLNWLTSRRVDLIQRLLLGIVESPLRHPLNKRFDVYFVKRTSNSQGHSPVPNESRVKVLVDHFYVNGQRFNIPPKSIAPTSGFLERLGSATEIFVRDLDGQILPNNGEAADYIKVVKQELYDRLLSWTRPKIKELSQDDLSEMFSQQTMQEGAQVCQRGLIIDFGASAADSDPFRQFRNVEQEDCLTNLPGMQILDYLGIDLAGNRQGINVFVGDKKVQQSFQYLKRLPFVIDNYDVLSALFKSVENSDFLVIPGHKAMYRGADHELMTVRAFTKVSMHSYEKNISSIAEYPELNSLDMSGALVAYRVDQQGRYRIRGLKPGSNLKRGESYFEYCFDYHNFQTRFIVSDNYQEIESAKKNETCSALTYPLSIDELEFEWQHKDSSLGGLIDSALSIVSVPRIEAALLNKDESSRDFLSKYIDRDSALYLATDDGVPYQLKLPSTKVEQPTKQKLLNVKSLYRHIRQSQPYIVDMPVRRSFLEQSRTVLIGEDSPTSWATILVYPVYVTEVDGEDSEFKLKVHVFDITNPQHRPKLISVINAGTGSPREIHTQLVSLFDEKTSDSNSSDDKSAQWLLCFFSGKAFPARDFPSLGLDELERPTLFGGKASVACIDLGAAQWSFPGRAQVVSNYPSHFSGVSAYDGNHDGFTDAIFSNVSYKDGESVLARLSISDRSNYLRSLFEPGVILKTKQQLAHAPVLLNISEDLVSAFIASDSSVMKIVAPRMGEDSDKILGPGDLLNFISLSNMEESVSENNGWIFHLDSEERANGRPYLRNKQLYLPIARRKLRDACVASLENRVLKFALRHAPHDSNSAEDGLTSHARSKTLENYDLGANENNTEFQSRPDKELASELERLQLRTDSLYAMEAEKQKLVLKPLSWSLR